MSLRSLNTRIASLAAAQVETAGPPNVLIRLPRNGRGPQIDHQTSRCRIEFYDYVPPPSQPEKAGTVQIAGGMGPQRATHPRPQGENAEDYGLGP